MANNTVDPRSIQRTATRFSRILVAQKKNKADAANYGQYPGYVPVTVRAASGQTADLLQFTDVAGTVLGGFDANGQLKSMNAPTTAPYGVPQYADVTVSNAELKALRATPKTLVAAPGAGRMVQFIWAQLLNTGGANALTETADNMGIKFTDGSGVQVSQDIESTGFIDQTAATVTVALPKIDAIVAVASCANKALVLHNTGDGEWGGNAAADVTLKVRVGYRVVPTA